MCAHTVLNASLSHRLEHFTGNFVVVTISIEKNVHIFNPFMLCMGRPISALLFLMYFTFLLEKIG
jgi:hypothetical protein